MRDFVLMTDSMCDLPSELADQLGLRVLPLSFHIGERTYRNWLDERDMRFADFYDHLRAGELSTTSAVNVGDFADAMEKELAAGRDILCLSFSSGMSTTYQSACIAAEQVGKEHPEGKIYVVDTLCASGGQGLLVWLCAREKAAGKSLEELRDYAEATKGRVCHWFTVDDLNHLKRGGRINAATALLGTMLSVKPVLHVDDAGKLESVSKARGRKAAIAALIDHYTATADKPEEQTVFITHGDCREDADFLAGELRRRNLIRDAVISYVGPVIGSHTGPGVLTLFFLGGPR